MNHVLVHALHIILAIVFAQSLMGGTGADSANNRAARPTSFFEERLSLTFTLANQQAYDWLLGEVFFIDGRCSVRYKNSWSTPSVQVSTEARGHIATLFNASQDVGAPHLRCTDSELSCNVTGIFPRGWVVDPYVRLSCKTPITEVFPSQSSGGSRSATWWDPVQSEQSCGFHVRTLPKPSASVSLLFGTGSQQIRARHHTRLTDDRSTSQLERFKSTIGMECLIQSEIEIDSLIRIVSNCQTRTSALRISAAQCSIENEVRVTLWKMFGLSLTTSLRYEPLLSKRLMYRQSAQLGLLLDY